LVNNARNGTVGEGTFTKFGRMLQELIFATVTGLQISRTHGASPALGGFRLMRKQTVYTPLAG